MGFGASKQLTTARNGSKLEVAGLVLLRQRPSTGNGVILGTLEDETGIANIIVWPNVFERFRRAVLSSSLLGVGGHLPTARD